ncbi:MAG: adenylate/guanylate cyclase domain-containing protein [Acidiferrobacterales bacterium]
MPALATIKDYLARTSARSDYARLPPRVREAIRRQQQSSEILIGWIQLGVVITFAVLYTLAPKTFTEEAEFAPVPWALATYFVFTVARLILAHSGRLPDWMLYLSVVVDMVLLLGLIWSFHLQYKQPASFYLKTPTLLYVFIFITLRALRFQARFVILAGSAAAIGWLFMVWYVISIDPDDPMITRNYVEYLTSNSVLLGAEFDKIISILLVTAILAVAIARARRLLIQSVVDSSTAQDLSRFVPTEVVRRVRSSERGVEAGQGEVGEATIFFTDIEGFTTICQSLEPEQVINTLNEYFTAVAEPIERYGGVINQFQGDAILASFNLPERHPEHAANAIRAALEIQAVLQDRTFGSGIALKSRIGINTGTVVGGLVGTGKRLGYTVHGDDVNLAARLEQLNKEYGTRIIISDTTCELAGRDRFSFKRMGKVQVRGRTAPTTIYSVSSS